MQIDRETSIRDDFSTFIRELHAAEGRLDLAPGVAQYVELAREAAFRAGWAAGQHWQEQVSAEAPTVRCRPLGTVRGLVDVGARGWVQPLAIIEHVGTGDWFVDPLFTISRDRSARCCIQLVVTRAGLVASGPPDRHRLCPEVDRDRLRPLVDFDPLAVG